MTIEEMIRAAMSRSCTCDDCKSVRGETIIPKSHDVQVRMLRDVYDQLSKRFDWTPGMLVCHKLGLESGYRYDDGEIFIISRIFDPPIDVSEEEDGGLYHGRKFDIAILKLLKDGSAIEFAVDGRFFEPHLGEGDAA